MKVTVLKGTVYRGAKHYGPGQIVDLDDKTAGELIAAGFVSKPGAPKTAEELAAESEAAAKKRKKAEEAAVKKGLGTAEEIAALSDEDLQSLFKDKK